MMFFKISPKNCDFVLKLLPFMQRKIQNIVLKNISTENRRKSQRLVIVTLSPGGNPTIFNYNASVVKNYSATNSMARF
jgi:hypothetical protein